MQAERSPQRWRLYLAGPEGKRRPVPDLVVPTDIVTPKALVHFLDDHFHELATPANATVRIVD